MAAPTATYRLQLGPGFGFEEARRALPYLARLGISHLYSSPVLQARKGSSHGYDVVDPTVVSPELGGKAGLQLLLGELRRLEMGLLLDIVPNHMAFTGDNPMLADVLENGPASRYFGFFDVEWDHPYESMKGRLLAPFLGDFYGRCLEKGEIQLLFDRGGFQVRYYDSRLPLRIDSYDSVLAGGLAELRRSLGREHPDYLKFLGALYVLRHLPQAEQLSERHDQIAFAKGLLWELYSSNGEIHRYLDARLRSINGEPGVPSSFDALDRLLREQLFRLSFWKVGTEELNYRRFFNVNELISVRVEQQQVFDHLHALVFSLASELPELGLRIDHVDGLYDPEQYLRRLRQRLPSAYLVVEKVLQAQETLPPSWPVAGSTGYDFLNMVNALCCSRRSRLSLSRIYRRFGGGETPFAGLLLSKKRLVAAKHMTGDVDNLARLLKGLASHYRYASDFTLYGFRRALAELLAQFPVYRSYLSPGEEAVREEERAAIETAVRRSIEALPDFQPELELIRNILTLRFEEEELPAEQRRQWYHFIQRFQQFTGPLMAKGLEDTALYVYNRLLSLNEVGGNPDKLGISLIEFHHFNRKRAASWGTGLNATSTHDTKRGEDVRARLNVLSELPQEWEQQVGQWRRFARRYKSTVNGVEAPDTNDEYFLYQTLLGAFPFRERDRPEFARRLRGYLVKAVREAKVHTAWLAPDAAYEGAYLEFAAHLVGGEEAGGFLQLFLPFQRRIAWYGMLNSLTQTLLKVSCPGVPDFYQGTELWELSLVDPDNRRPVDFALRQRLLAELESGEKAQGLPGLMAALFREPEEGAIKLLLVRQALAARRSWPEPFREGSYLPLRPRGDRHAHLVAFGRKRGPRWALVAAPRFFVSLAPQGRLPLGEEVWGENSIAAPRGVARWRNALTGETLPGGAHLPVGRLFSVFPGALLLGEEGGGRP
jgi:(1->4)-alpha-D-glucan 1-alpha-D-glucosylmutase